MNGKPGRQEPEILERCIRYSLDIFILYRQIEKDDIGRILGRQLVRSGTSIGANVHEAQGGQSKADFIAKVSVAHKEAFESNYWLRLIHDAKIKPDLPIRELQKETGQLVKILSSILISSKEKKKDLS